MSNPHPQESSRLGELYNLVTGDEDARVCKDIPESACHHMPRNYFAYLLANFFNKVADELSSARLILPWLLGTVGAPSSFVGFLVPIREAGVLVPQLMVAAYVRRMAKRKGVWLLGGVLSALALLLMAMTATTLTGAAAGWAILALVTVFSLARGLCSVSAKDVLGKTVSKTRRGSVMGYSASAAGVVTLLIGVLVEWQGGASTGAGFFMYFLLAAALIWVLAIVSFAAIIEAPGATEGGGNALAVALAKLRIVVDDHEFRQYLISRILLLSVALAPPFYVLLAQENVAGVTGLGLLIVASGLGNALSSPIWGRMGDRSSRLVMVIASVGAGVLGIGAWLIDVAGWQVLQGPVDFAVLFLLIVMFHSGVRLGRKVYLVDMANAETRADYVAVSNTLIGVAMMAGGFIGLLADLLTTSSVLAVLGVISLLAAVYISRIKEVSG